MEMFTSSCSCSCAEQAASTGELKEEEKGGRVIYGKDIDKESDDIKYKWNAIFHK